MTSGTPGAVRSPAAVSTTAAIIQAAVGSTLAAIRRRHRALRDRGPATIAGDDQVMRIKGDSGRGQESQPGRTSPHS